jgi:hypothetical protein
MHAMRAADRDRPSMFDGAASDRLNQHLKAGEKEVCRISCLDPEARVDDVRGRQAEVDEARCITDGLADGPEEGDHIMVRLALDLLHALEIA